MQEPTYDRAVVDSVVEIQAAYTQNGPYIDAHTYTVHTVCRDYGAELGLVAGHWKAGQCYGEEPELYVSRRRCRVLARGA